MLKKALEAGLMREGESHVRGLLKEGAEEIVAESCRRKLESVRFSLPPLVPFSLEAD